MDGKYHLAATNAAAPFLLLPFLPLFAATARARITKYRSYHVKHMLCFLNILDIQRKHREFAGN